jgi:hypothetical protein
MPFATQWARRSYFIERGHIKPIPQSKVRVYDPFKQQPLNRNLSSKDGDRPLYAQLINVDEWDEKDIIRFCNDFGLLGLFQHNLIQARYVPTDDGRVQCLHDPPFDFPEIIEGPSFRSELTPLSQRVDEDEVQYRIREAVRFSPQLGSCEEELREDIVEELREEALEFWRKDRRCRGLVIRWTPACWVEEPLIFYFRTYFPGAGLTFPSLHAPELWDSLCEPVGEFRQSVMNLRSLFHTWSEWSASSKAPGDHTWASRAIDEELLRVHPTTAGSGSWFCPSLLSCIHTTMYLDITRQKLPRKCANSKCERQYFLANREDNQYCSSACQASAKQRRLRERRKSEFEYRLNQKSKLRRQREELNKHKKDGKESSR